jgi:RNA 3'-terminal phosphate cyclase (ATP)
MGDQLLSFLAISGGRVRVPTVTDHVKTRCELLEAFGVEVGLERAGETAVVSVTSPLGCGE